MARCRAGRVNRARSRSARLTTSSEMSGTATSRRSCRRLRAVRHSAPVPIELVDQDAFDVGVLVVGPLHPPPVAEGLDERLLHQVVGQMPVAAQQIGGAVQRSGAATGEFPVLLFGASSSSPASCVVTPVQRPIRAERLSLHRGSSAQAGSVTASMTDWSPSCRFMVPAPNASTVGGCAGCGRHGWTSCGRCSSSSTCSACARWGPGRRSPSWSSG